MCDITFFNELVITGAIKDLIIHLTEERKPKFARASISAYLKRTKVYKNRGEYVVASKDIMSKLTDMLLQFPVEIYFVRS